MEMCIFFPHASSLGTLKMLFIFLCMCKWIINIIMLMSDEHVWTLSPCLECADVFICVCEREHVNERSSLIFSLGCVVCSCSTSPIPGTSDQTISHCLLVSTVTRRLRGRWMEGVQWAVFFLMNSTTILWVICQMWRERWGIVQR